MVKLSFTYIGPDERGDWQEFRHDLSHSGRSAFAGPLSPIQKWAVPTVNLLESSPAIAADGTIYLGAFDTNLYAVNPNGILKWAFPTEDSIISSPALGADGTCFIGLSR